MHGIPNWQSNDCIGIDESFYASQHLEGGTLPSRRGGK